MKNLLCISLMIFLFSNLIIGQTQSNSDMARFNVQVEASSFILINAFSVSAEGRIISSNNNKIHLLGKAGIGSLSIATIFCETLKSTGGNLGLTMLTGKGDHHFELNGAVFLGSFKYKDDELGILNCADDGVNLGFRAQPLVDLGYRFQRPGEGFIFRAKIGFTGLGIAVGYAFNP